MNTHGKYSTNKLNDLVHEKEQEWRTLLQEHVDTLAKELAEKDERIALEKLRFSKLKEDFEYNLKLLEERDNDLQKYEQLFEQFKANDNLNNHQVSEMKIKVDEFQTKFTILQKEKEEVQHHYQTRLKNYQEEMNKFYLRKDEEHQKEKNEYEELKRKLQRKIMDTEEEIGFEKQKLLNQLEETMRQKEKEYQIKLDQKEAESHSYQLKMKMLSREFDFVKTSNAQSFENVESNKERTIQLEKIVKEKEWQIQDLNNTKDLKIKELEKQMEEHRKQVKWKEEEFQRKYCEVEKLANEREMILTNLRMAADDNEKRLYDNLNVLQQQKEDYELNCKRLQWQVSDNQNEKDQEVQKYIEKIENLERKLKEDRATMNKDTVARDLELETLRSSEDWLRQEVNKLKSNIDRLKKDLTLSMDRERILENGKAQLELDWRRRFETKESELYEKHDDLIRNLDNEKDDAVVAMKQRENELIQCENLIKLLKDDKEIAIKCLKKHGINTNSLFTDSIPERESEIIGGRKEHVDLQQQNNQLKDVIKEMRAEMEMLSLQITSHTSTPSKANPENSNYVNDLEAEIQNLKTSNRQFLTKIEDLTKHGKPPAGTVGKMHVNLSDTGIKGYIKELNDTIGALRNDKTFTAASLKSKDATVSHLHETVSKLSNEKQQQLVVIENFKYDMSSKAKVYEQNISSLKDRVSQLELRLQQSRSEAEVYYKTVIERNLDASQANNKISDLKIQQSTLTTVPCHPKPETVECKPTTLYKEKLKLAVERIKELTTERSQLINVGNKLRAELAKLKENTQTLEAFNNDKKASTINTVNMRQYGNKIQSKLDKLEQLQYEATSMELKRDPKIKEIDVDIQLLSTENSDRTENGNMEGIETLEKENLSPSPLRTSTTSEHSSIKEIWKLLENVEKEISKDSIENRDDLSLIGKHIEPDKKNTPRKSLAFKSKKGRGPINKPSVRNYNQRSDS